MSPTGPRLAMAPGRMPTLHFPGERRPGQFGPSTRAPRSRASACAFAMSSTGTPSVIATTNRIPASAASMTAPAANAGGTYTTDVSAPVSATASSIALKIGTFLPFGPSKVWPPFPGVTPATTCVPAYSIICRAWKEPSRPVMPCTTTRVLSSMKIDMVFSVRLGQLDGFLDHLVHRGVRAEARALQNAQRLRLVGPGEPDHDGDLYVDPPRRFHDAARHVVAARDAAEDVEEDRLHVLVRGD